MFLQLHFIYYVFYCFYPKVLQLLYQFISCFQCIHCSFHSPFNLTCNPFLYFSTSSLESLILVSPVIRSPNIDVLNCTQGKQDQCRGYDCRCAKRVICYRTSLSFLTMTTKLSKHVECLLRSSLNKDLCKLIHSKKQNPQETQE